MCKVRRFSQDSAREPEVMDLKDCEKGLAVNWKKRDKKAANDPDVVLLSYNKDKISFEFPRDSVLPW